MSFNYYSPLKNEIKGRIAPTPSGFLHIGNAYNFLVTYREVVHKRQGGLFLRIDDGDSARVRDEYLSDIFDSLAWLNIGPLEGPKDLFDFKKKFSQANRKDRYWDFLKKIPNTFVCECSRKFLETNQCPCLEKKLVFEKEKNSIRTLVNDKELFAEMGHFILWRKDDLPSYQLASLVDDIDLGINFVVRGEDLIYSTKAQFHLSELIKDEVFSKAHFLHHPLIKTSTGEKLSKSTPKDIAHNSLKFLRESGKNRDDLLTQLGFLSWEQFLES